MNSRYELVVQPFELDSFGHVNNAEYLHYAEAAKWDFFQKSGLLDRLQIIGYHPVIMENHLRYLHELHMMDQVVVLSNWQCTQGVMEYKHVIKKLATNEIACKVEGKLVLVDAEQLICDIPDDIREYCNRVE